MLAGRRTGFEQVSRAMWRGCHRYRLMRRLSSSTLSGVILLSQVRYRRTMYSESSWTVGHSNGQDAQTPNLLEPAPDIARLPRSSSRTCAPPRSPRHRSPLPILAGPADESGSSSRRPNPNTKTCSNVLKSPKETELFPPLEIKPFARRSYHPL